MRIPKEEIVVKTNNGKTLLIKANVQMRDSGDAPLSNTPNANIENNYGQLLIFCKKKDLQGEDVRGARLRYEGKIWQITNSKFYKFSPLKEDCRLIAESNL